MNPITDTTMSASTGPDRHLRWRAISELLEVAACRCDERGDLADKPMDDRAVWFLDALLVRSAADTLHLALPPSNAAFDEITPNSTDPLQLLEQAWRELEATEDDLLNTELLTARPRLADALDAVRGHYE
jgi:hypothetical protein